MHWEQTETGIRCGRHAKDFARGHACPDCVAEPQSVETDLFVSPEARWLAISAARKMERSAAWYELALKAAGENELGHAAKLGTLSLQYERAADEQIKDAHAEDKEQRLVEHDREMAGLERQH